MRRVVNQADASGSGRYSDPVDLSWLTQNDVRRAASAVRMGPRAAAGPDGRAPADFFGDGPEDPRYHYKLKKIGASKKAYRFSAPKIQEVDDVRHEKVRAVMVTTMADAVVLRALNDKLAGWWPWSRIAVCRPALDSRWSVAELSLVLQERGGDIVRTDFRSAFPSLLWPKVLASAAALTMPPGLRAALETIYRFYSPSGVGAPLGLATSPMMLEIACARMDARLADTRIHVRRYMDDGVAVVESQSQADRVLGIVRQEGRVYGLTPHPHKTVVSRSRRRIRSMDLLQPAAEAYDAPAVWLGHEILPTAVIDVARGPVDWLFQRDLTPEGVRAWIDHFRLAAAGERYRRTAEELEEYLDSEHKAATRPVAPHLLGIPAALDGKESPGEVWDNMDHTLGKEGDGIDRSHPRHGEGEHDHPPVRSSPSRESTTGAIRSCAGRGGHQAAQHTAGTLSRGGSRRRTRPQGVRRRGPGRTRQAHLQLLGGRRGLLQLASTWASCVQPSGSGSPEEEQTATKTAAWVLFNRPQKKIQQMARAADLWTFVIEVLRSRGVRLARKQEEWLLAWYWKDLMICATLVRPLSRSHCIDDPVVVLLDRMAGGSRNELWRRIDQERQARQDGARPINDSEFADLLPVSTR